MTLERLAHWLDYDECAQRAPKALWPWLSESGLLSNRVKSFGGAVSRFRLLRVAPAAIDEDDRCLMGVSDAHGLERHAEFCCRSVRWIYKMSLFPRSTVDRHPWLADLGSRLLDETLAGMPDIVRGPFEYRELSANHVLSNLPHTPNSRTTSRHAWARRAVYRISGDPIIIAEIFCPILAVVDPLFSTSTALVKHAEQASGRSPLRDVQLITEFTASHIEQLHHLFQTEWWTFGRSVAATRQCIAGSQLCVGLLNQGNELIGFSRVLTDFVFKAVVFDLIIDRRYRQQGLGRHLLNWLKVHESLRNVQHFDLHCLPEMHEFSRQQGFSEDVSALRLER